MIRAVSLLVVYKAQRHFSWDNVLTLNDMFYISGTRSFKRDSMMRKGIMAVKILVSIILFLGRTIS